MNEERQETPERVGAFTGFRGDLALAADRPQQHVEAPLPRGGAALDLEDRVGQALDLGLEALDEIGEPVDDGVEQSDHDGGAALEIGLGAIAPRHEDGEGPGLGIAHRDEPLSGENERRRRGPRVALVGGVKQRRRHEIGAVLLVESARGLDLQLLLAGRHVEFERALDLLLLVLGGIEEIDPHRFFADPGLALLARERAGAVLIDGEHPTSRFPGPFTSAKTLYQQGSIATETMRPTDAKNASKMRQFFCTIQAPPSARRRLHSASASSRLSAPICTKYMDRRPRLRFRSGCTNGSRSPRSDWCACLSRPNWASAFAFENEVETLTPHGRQAPLAVSGSVS